MRVVTYGLGGYDPTIPGGNIVEDYDDGQPDVVLSTEVQVTVDPDALTSARTAVTKATTVAALRTALATALDLLTPTGG